MIGFRPPRPVGTTPEAMFMQAVWDALWGAAGSENRANDVSGFRVQRTTRGMIIQGAQVTTAIPGSGMNYRGDYDKTAAYVFGDVVRVRSGPYQGVFICVLACSGTAPVYPEPADTGGTNNWEIFALGIKTVNICSNGTTGTANVNTDAAF